MTATLRNITDNKNITIEMESIAKQFKELQETLEPLLAQEKELKERLVVLTNDLDVKESFAIDDYVTIVVSETPAVSYSRAMENRGFRKIVKDMDKISNKPIIEHKLNVTNFTSQAKKQMGWTQSRIDRVLDKFRTVGEPVRKVSVRCK